MNIHVANMLLTSIITSLSEVTRKIMNELDSGNKKGQTNFMIIILLEKSEFCISLVHMNICRYL